MPKSLVVITFVVAGAILWILVPFATLALVKSLGGRAGQLISMGGEELLALVKFWVPGFIAGRLLDGYLGSLAIGGWRAPDYSFYVLVLVIMAGIPVIVTCLGVCVIEFSY